VPDKVISRFLSRSTLTQMLVSLLLFVGMGAEALADQCDDYNFMEPKPFVASVRSGAWSDPGTWGGAVPDRNDNVRVLHELALDGGWAREVQISGALEIRGELQTHGSVIVCQSGVLTGSAGAIVFQIDRDRQVVGNDPADPAGMGFNPDDIGLWVFGRINLAGEQVTSWLNAEPGGGWQNFAHGVSRAQAVSEGAATLSEAPANWLPGDTLVITTEQGDYSLAELSNVNGRQITYLADDPVTGFALRYRGDTVLPKIGNLSRRFVISAEGGRAHTIYMPGAVVRISGVEFRDLGPRGKLGRYPVHFHRMGTADAVFTGNSIWQQADEGGNRFITIHASQGVIIADNVMLRSQGHGVFMEEGPEYDNVLTGNLTIDLRWPELLPNVDSGIFAGTSHAPNHYWVRQGNTYRNNVAVGGDIDNWPFNRFTELNGIGLIQGEKRVDTVVDGFECLGCGGFGAWTYVGTENVTFSNAKMVYSRVANWYPVLGRTRISDSTLLLGGRNTNWPGQAFFNAKGAMAEVINTHMAGAYGINLHYIGDARIYGGSVTANDVIKPNYWENTASFYGVELNGKALFSSELWGAHKRNAPVPIWLKDDTTYNGRIVEGMFVRYPDHSRYFETVGTPYNTGIQVVEEPAFWLPKPIIRGQGYYGDRYFRTVTPLGGQERTVAAVNENESEYQKSIAQGNLGYPHGFPAGTYVVRYYDRGDQSYLNREEVFTLGGSAPANLPPEARLLTRRTVYRDTDGQPGETIRLEASALDRDGSLRKVEWLVDGEVISNLLSVSLDLADGEHVVVFRAVDDQGFIASDSLRFSVLAPRPTPPSVMTGNSDFSATKALIRIGATTEDQQTFRTVFSVGERLRLIVRLEPEAVDVGSTSEVYILASVADTERYFLLTPSGLQSWDGSAEQLVAFDRILLAPQNEIDVLSRFGGELTLTFNEAGTYTFLVGYTTSSGLITYSEQPFRFRVVSGEDFTL
jgi:hypothetical protein